MWRRRPWWGWKGAAVGLRRWVAGLASRGGVARGVLKWEARGMLEWEARGMLEGDTREEELEGEAREVVLDGDIMVEMFPLLERSWKTMELSKAQAAAGGQGSDLRKSGEEPGALGVTSAPAILKHSGKDILHTGASTWLAAGPVAADRKRDNRSHGVQFHLGN